MSELMKVEINGVPFYPASQVEQELAGLREQLADAERERDELLAVAAKQKDIGHRMSNICYTLSQDKTIQSNTCRVMDELRREWDTLSKEIRKAAKESNP